MNSDKELFARLTEKVVNQESLSSEEARLWIEYLLKLGRGKDSFKSISEQLGSVLGDITDWKIEHGDLKFDVNGMTIPLSSFFTNSYSIPTLSGDTATSINDVAVIGTKLYIAFGDGANSTMTIGGITARGIVSFDLQTGRWAPLSGGGLLGLSGTAYSLAVNGTDLYIGGDFNNPGGAGGAAGLLCVYDTTTETWSDVGGNVGLGTSYIQTAAKTLTVSDGVLYVGGTGDLDGSQRILKYTIATDTWGTLGSGINEAVYAIVVSGSAVYAGCDDYIKLFNGSTWSTIVTLTGGGSACYALELISNKLYFTGDFTSPQTYIGYYDTSAATTKPLATGLNGIGRTLTADGSALCIGGAFTTPGSQFVKWENGKFVVLGDGTTGGSGLLCSVLYESTVIIGGTFTTAGGRTAQRLAFYFTTLEGILDYLDGASAKEADASQINFSPAGEIAATNVQTAIEELDTEATKDADTDVSGNSWVLDEDTFSSNSATKVPTQQSAKVYVDTIGSDGQILFSDSGTRAGATTLLWDKTLGNVTLGSLVPPAPGTRVIHQIHEDASPAHALWAFSSSYAGFLKFYKGNGTVASPTAILADEILGRIRAYGYNGAAWDAASQAVIQFVATGNFSNGDTPTKIEFYTTPDGSGTPAVHLGLDENGLDLLERSTDAATPGANRWRIFFKADGPYIIDDAGSVTGPLGAGGAWDGDITDIDVTSSADIGAAIADDDQGIIYDTSATAWVRFAFSRIWTYISGKIQAITDSTGYPWTANDGWIPDANTWTRTGNHTFTVAADVTATLRKGVFVRYKQGGAYEYGVVYSATYSDPNTTVTLITNSDYAMAAAAITDNAYSLVANPEGWPDVFNYTPTVTIAGGYNSLVIVDCSYRVSGAALYFWHRLTVTLTDTATNTIQITAPTVINLNGNNNFVSTVIESPYLGRGNMNAGTNNLYHFKPTLANFAAAASGCSGNGSYPL